MSGKKGRKCSMKNCESYQHTHKHLSFFRFPKDPERCKLWIERSERPDLLEKTNVHEERVCERHFSGNMFLNEYRNRLHPSAVPTLKPIDHMPMLSDLSSVIDLSIPLTGDNKMSKKAELLYRAQLAANNLTITPSNGPPKVITNGNQNQHSSPVKDTIISPIKSQLPKLNTITSSTNTNASTSVNYRRPRQIFTPQQEEELAVYVRDTANYYSGLSSKEVRILAFVYGVCNQVEMPTGWHETHQASFDWCVGFIKRNKLSTLVINSVSNKNNNNNSNSNMKSSKASIPNNNNNNNHNHNKAIIEQSNNKDVTPIEVDE